VSVDQDGASPVRTGPVGLDRLGLARARAAAFVQTEAGFAQVTTIGRHGLPVGRTMSAFLVDDWSVELLQRGTHHRVAQLRRDPRVLVTWVGTPAEGAHNDRPHVFDLGLLVPRVVFVQGYAEPLDEEQTWAGYQAHSRELRTRGGTRAPERDRADVAAALVGFRVHPARVRLEGFGEAAESFGWDGPPSAPRHHEADG
jgi:hypothetical protein